MQSFVGVLAVLAVALLGIGTLYAVARLTAVAPDPVRSLPFLSGHDPLEHALSRFHVRWYPVTLIFLAFDVEMLFMYPWAVVVAQMGSGAVIEMFVFLGVLLAGVAWAWREGALRWV
ncbi:NADH-quinone oxidoreductase subunit A [Kineococcus rubinsiae]|uniref:NADH-quinone oxidoreductase subunit A n=1 Tax=Kineococcus rubinsiae TaxID=2609562 RepID=UPI00142FACB5|nr:NADH-quinone oxidoreductase subunit A [Kineococcus rubinsiae]NIZ92571.1 NADH-quinone oxidoreductase subunit A [Kineococcus rubinsiae]